MGPTRAFIFRSSTGYRGWVWKPLKRAEILYNGTLSIPDDSVRRQAIHQRPAGPLRPFSANCIVPISVPYSSYTLIEAIKKESNHVNNPLHKITPRRR